MVGLMELIFKNNEIFAWKKFYLAEHRS